jgi:hypothetical protein
MFTNRYASALKVFSIKIEMEKILKLGSISNYLLLK